MIYRYKVQKVHITGNIATVSAIPAHVALKFRAGQYASVGFMQGWRPSPMRCFSIIGSPDSDVIRFAVRINGNFTQSLASLKSGDELLIRGGFGSFYLDSTDRRVVLLASGIGITPFLSMLQRPPRIPITLLYSNRSAQHIPFYDELRKLAAQHKQLKLGFFATYDAETKAAVIPGRITDTYIQKITSDGYADSTYFICGSNNFIQQMQTSLGQAGVNPDMIVSESFTQKTKGSKDSYATIRRTTYGVSAAALAVLIIGITVLDLSHTVPKLVSTETRTQQTTRGASKTTTSSTRSDKTTPDNSSSSSPNNSSSDTSSTAQNAYQSPVSSVS